jgi:hypothetical protein
MKRLLCFVRSQLNRFGLLPIPEPEQLDFFARLEPTTARKTDSRIGNRRI